MEQKPVDIAKAAVEHAKSNQQNVVLIDTAGRLHIDENMMQELADIKANIQVDATILVVDAMTGQDAVNVAKTFTEKVGIDGVILTKMDGDTRGGAALSIKAVTGKPLLYVGMGEKLSDLEQFYPERMASRILGMGDVMSLIEKVEASVDQEQAQEMQKKLKKMDFDFNDYLTSMDDVMSLIEKVEASVDQEQAQEMQKKLKKMDFDFNDYLTSMEQMNKMGGFGSILSEKVEASVDQEQAQEMQKKLKKMDFDFNDYLTSMEQMNKMGGFGSILSMLPGVGSKVKELEGMIDEKAMDRTKSIILSMTAQERSNPSILNISRKNRIAKGAGVDVSEVNRLVKQFEQSKKMMKQMPGLMGGKVGKRGGFKLPF